MFQAEARRYCTISLHMRKKLSSSVFFMACWSRSNPAFMSLCSCFLVKNGRWVAMNLRRRAMASTMPRVAVHARKKVINQLCLYTGTISRVKSVAVRCSLAGGADGAAFAALVSCSLEEYCGEGDDCPKAADRGPWGLAAALICSGNGVLAALIYSRRCGSK